MAIQLAALFLGGTQLASSIMQSGAIRSQGSFEAGQYERNAELSRFQADESIRMGETEALQKAQQVKRLRGRQRAVAAAQGVDVSSGSALDIQQDTMGLGALDIATIRNNAWKQAWGYRVEASNMSTQANFTRISSKYKARQTLLTGGLQAASSIMSGYTPSSGGGRVTGSGSFASGGMRASTPSASWVRSL